MNESRPSMFPGSTIAAPVRAWLAAVVLLLVLPALGFFAVSGDGRIFEFPPRTIFVPHAAFSWLWWAVSAAATFALVSFVFAHTELRPRWKRGPGRKTAIASGLLGVSWILAWSRFGWASGLQLHTFILLWLSYILLMNALLEEIHGSSPLTRATKPYLASFPLSMVFWWGFEVLNRYTQNWHYRNVESFTAASYFLFASLSFALVLPSIWATREFFERTLLAVKPAVTLTIAPPVAQSAAALTALVLFAIPMFPDYLFPAVWIAPPVLVSVLAAVRLGKTISVTEMLLWAVAGLWCGFLWELWNWRSVAGWEYLIPFVQRFPIFEMPLTGYGGYIPFGIFCGMLIETLKEAEARCSRS